MAELKCIRWAQMEGFPEVPAALPASRVTQAKPFEIVGTDFAGPLYVLLERPTKKKKKKQKMKKKLN